MKSVLIVLLTLELTACSSGNRTPTLVNSTPAKAVVPKDDDGHDLTPPEVVHTIQVQNNVRGVKRLSVGNVRGEYLLSCNIKESTCLTPSPGRDYYVFTKTTKWKFNDATGYVTLEWLQSWSGIYTSRENIALLPVDENRSPEQMGMYWLDSWTASAGQH